MNYLETAKRIVEAERRLYPGCEDAVNIGGGSTDTKFRRVGTSQTQAQRDLPSGLTDLITSNYNVAQPSTSLLGQQSSFLSDIFNKTPSNIPGYGFLNSQMSLNPTSFPGSGSLETMAQRDPYSSTFEDQTAEAYKQRASDAMAQVASGPDAVRGGAARTGIAQGVLADRLAQGRGQEVRDAQVQDAGIVQNAAQLSNLIESARRGVGMQAQNQLGQGYFRTGDQQFDAARTLEANKLGNMSMLQLAGELLGSRNNTTTDDLSGRGSQSSFQWNVLSGCCFIFLEALNGKLPWYIELARRDYYTEDRKLGYKWMAQLLVPWMRKSKVARWTVNTFMVRRFLSYGSWLYGAGSKTGWMWAPLCKSWMGVWGYIGRQMKG